MRLNKTVADEILRIDSEIVKHQSQLELISDQYGTKQYKLIKGKIEGLKIRLRKLVSNYMDKWGYDSNHFFDLLNNLDQDEFEG